MVNFEVDKDGWALKSWQSVELRKEAAMEGEISVSFNGTPVVLVPEIDCIRIDGYSFQPGGEKLKVKEVLDAWKSMVAGNRKPCLIEMSPEYFAQYVDWLARFW